jgi:hypothetical protein
MYDYKIMASTTRNCKQSLKVGKKIIVIEPDMGIKAAKRSGYKDVYIPKSLRNKINIVINKNGDVVIKSKKSGSKN